ncbi:YdeI/OmpD-associated family protein [Solitalea sp. MAHUQ-68]|uniref:YdeI/OmpD-associated family protein n=1 Tax=Solitalea agri TaxID=2953739 RepID=A0A9X2F5W7_9SPHI|nr:YdeI/OmpD-associated family protein [Solitalea agri]MCO4291388.1 YdeI/OmpD-associated family protein [Solitalea agri]
MPQNPLHQKLQIKEGSAVLLINAPTDYNAVIGPLPENASLFFEPTSAADVIQLFIKNKAELVEELKKVTKVLKPTTVFWICYPKKSSGIASDLNMMDSWSELDQYGLQGVSAAAINETWTALRFKPIDQVKKSEVRNEELEKNDYSAYIDVQNKLITLPADLKSAMEASPASVNHYEKLSYTNKKEYVLWVLTAKQDKTRVDRIQKTVEKLLLGKKNPSEK